MPIAKNHIALIRKTILIQLLIWPLIIIAKATIVGESFFLSGATVGAFLITFSLWVAAVYALYFFNNRQWKLEHKLEAEHQELERLKEYFWLSLMPEKSSKTEDVFLKKLRQVLEEKYSEEHFDISHLCDALHMSRAQVYRKVKTLTGKPVGHLLRSFRMQKAKNLLESTDLSISQVSLEVGYKHLAHFSRSFHQEFGMNPSDVRK